MGGRRMVRKRPHAKVRTGCRQCKTRRIKCDEERPCCHRCMIKGITCEYVPVKAWIFESRTPPSKADDSASDKSRHSPTENGLIHFVSDRDFQFFVEVTAPLISSYESEEWLRVVERPADIDLAISKCHRFWCRVFPQLIQVRPTMKHAALALSASHESIEMMHQPTWRNSIFRQNYSKALQLVTRPEEKLPIEYVLISCIAFANVEFLNGKPFFGVRHVMSGAKIIEQYIHDPTADRATVELIRDGIMPAFECHLRYSQMAYPEQYTDGETPENDADSQNEDEADDISLTFSNIGEARHALFKVASLIMTVANAGPSKSKGNFPSPQSILLRFKDAYDGWKMSLEESKNQEISECRVLLNVYFKALTVVASNHTHEMASDKFFPEFRSIVTLSRELAGHFITEDLWKFENPIFQFHLGTIFPLFLVALECRHRRIRSQALELLRTLNAVEGMWNSCVAYAIAVKVRDIEEQPAKDAGWNESSVIPGQARIKLLGVRKGLQPNSVTLEYRRLSPRNSPAMTVHSVSLERTPCQWNADQAVCVAEIVRLCGYQGVVRPVPGRCTCQGSGVVMNEFQDASPGSLILAGRLPWVSRCLAGWGLRELRRSTENPPSDPGEVTPTPDEAS